MILQCAYGRGDKGETCLNIKELQEMTESLGEGGEQDDGRRKKSTKEELYKKLLNHYGVKNDAELIKKYNSKSKKKIEVDEILKPPTPGFYLSNTDIDMIFKQFANVHPEFMSYGGVPYDFWKKPEGSWKKNCDKIYGFDILKFVGGNKRIWGMVCNTSPSSHSGSHWVCMFFEVKGNTAKLEYFDSIGTNECRSMVNCNKDNVPTEIMKFIDIVKENCKKNGYKFKFTFNKTQHQRGNNECGMYCIYYILNRIKKVEYNDVVDIPDEKMTYLRNVLFRSPHYCWECKKYKTSIVPLIKKWG